MGVFEKDDPAEKAAEIREIQSRLVSQDGTLFTVDGVPTKNTKFGDYTKETEHQLKNLSPEERKNLLRNLRAGR